LGHALKVTENNAIAENNYGWVLLEEGKFDEAEVYFRNALRILPAYFDAQHNLGKVYLKQGNLNEAIACFNKLLQWKESANLHYDLAAALTMQKKYDDAINHLVRALELEPANTEARKKMGVLLNTQGKPDEAIKQLKQALETSPQDDEIYANLGMAYRRTGDNELAIQNLTKAVQLKPNNAIALTSLAWVLATKDEVTAEDANSAIKYALRACELTSYKEAAPLDTLAVANAAAGRFDEAVKAAKQAIETARANGQESAIGEMQKRLKLYEAGQPYRQK
jgi:tetratricopeptide (TPR) repeat protein